MQSTELTARDRSNINILGTVDILLPAQWDSPPVRKAEHEILVAVLQDALWTVVRGKGRRRKRDECWFASDEQSRITDFVPLCRALRLEPDYIRRKLRDLLANQEEVARSQQRIHRFRLHAVLRNQLAAA